MGWCIYWDYKKEKNQPSSFPDEFVTKVKDIITKSKVKLASWDGDTPIKMDDIVSKTCIMFNGVYPESCETFRLCASDPSGLGSDCCKTRGYAYSIVCLAILDLAMKYGIIDDYSTDGGAEYEEVMKQYNTVFENS